MHHTQDVKSTVAYIQQSLTEGRRIVCPCMSKTQAEKAYSTASLKFGDSKHMLLYTRDSTWKGEDVNEVWARADVLTSRNKTQIQTMRLPKWMQKSPGSLTAGSSAPSTHTPTGVATGRRATSTWAHLSCPKLWQGAHKTIWPEKSPTCCNAKTRRRTGDG